MKLLTNKAYCELKNEAAKIPLLEARLNPEQTDFERLTINQLRKLILIGTNELKKRAGEIERNTADYLQNNYKL